MRNLLNQLVLSQTILPFSGKDRAIDGVNVQEGPQGNLGAITKLAYFYYISGRALDPESNRDRGLLRFAGIPETSYDCPSNPYFIQSRR